MKLLRIVVLSGVGLGGWVCGSLSERYKFGLFNETTLHSVRTKHDLPIFSTVFAAVPTQSPPRSVEKVSRIAEIMQYGFPSLDNIRSLDDFVLSYDKRNRTANWVLEHLTKERIRKNDAVDRSKCEFHEDTSIHPYFRSQNSDYKGSGFDRGHLAAAGNHRICQQHIDQTFLLSNMAPQIGKGFNRDKWNKLEQYVRGMTYKYKNVYVCTGPLYLPRKEPDGKTYIKYQVIGQNNVAVPTHFFKVVVAENENQQLEMEAFVLPNQVISNEVPIHVFQVPLETIERAAGLLFFDKLSKDKLVKVNGRKSV